MVEGDAKLEYMCQFSVLVGQAHELCMEVAAAGVAQLLPTQEALLHRAQHVRYVPRNIAAFLHQDHNEAGSDKY